MSELRGDPTCPGCAALRKELEDLRADFKATVVALEARIAELTRQLHQNSSNSSKPPSSDPPWQSPSHTKPKSPRTRGGQPGHPGHFRRLLPKDRVTTTVPYYPQTCSGCGAPLPPGPQADAPKPIVHQVVELPEQPLVVTQYEGHACRCAACGYVTRAEIPAAIRAHSLGPRLTAFVAVLTGMYHLTKRQVQGLFETALGTPLGLGSIPKGEQEMTAALAPAYQVVRETAQQAPVKNIDETGWNCGGKLCWLWVVATATVAFYQITKSRGKRGFREVVRAVHCRIITDRWSAYSDWPLDQRQLCWSHLGRDFQRFYEMSGMCRDVGRAGRCASRRLFELWHQFKAGCISRGELERRMTAVRLKLERALERGRDSPDKKARRFCKRLLKVYPALWSFVTVEGVEPTNNHAERMVRPAVIWRKVSFGNNCPAGCTFAASILTIVQTLRLQQKPVLDYLTQAILAARTGAPCPAIL